MLASILKFLFIVSTITISTSNSQETLFNRRLSLNNHLNAPKNVSPFKLPFALKIAFLGLLKDKSIHINEFQAMLEAQMATHTPRCGINTPEERSMSLQYNIKYNLMHLEEEIAGLQLLIKIEKLLKEFMVPDQVLKHHSAKIILSSNFLKRLDAILMDGDSLQGQPRHTVFVLAPRKNNIRPSFITQDMKNDWTYTYHSNSKTSTGRNNASPSTIFVGNGRYFIIDVNALSTTTVATTSASVLSLYAPIVTHPGHANNVANKNKFDLAASKIMFVAKLHANIITNIPIVFLPHVSWCMNPTLKTHHLHLRMITYYDLGTYPKTQTTDRFGTGKTNLNIQSMKSILSKLLLPKQQLSIAPMQHLDLKKEIAMATLLWDSYLTETTYTQSQDSNTGLVVTVAKHRIYVDGSYLEQRIMDQQDGSISDIENATKEMEDTLTMYLFVGKDEKMTFHDGTRTWLGLNCILMLVSKEDNEINSSSSSSNTGSGGNNGDVVATNAFHDLESILLPSIIDSIFGVIPLRSGGGGGGYGSGGSNKNSQHRAVPLLGSIWFDINRVTSQSIIDAALRNAIIMRLDGVIGTTRSIIEQLDTFARNYLGYLGPPLRISSATATTEDLKVQNQEKTTAEMMPTKIANDPNNMIAHSFLEMNNIITSLVHLSFSHMDQEETLLAAHNTAQQLFATAVELHRKVLVEIEQSIATSTCCTTAFKRRSNLSGGVSVILGCVVLFSVIGLSMAMYGILMKFSLDDKRK